MNINDTKLNAACEALDRWQQARTPEERKDHCLSAMREALASQGVKLPMSNVDYPGDLAITCGETLAANPKKWGWARVQTPEEAGPQVMPAEIALVFFNDCGKLPDGRVAGHIAIYKPSTDHIVSNETFVCDSWWRARLAYVFQLMEA